MSLRSRQAFVALILVIPILLGGCWSRREIEQLAFVQGVAVDNAAEPGKVQLTVELARPSALAATSQGGGSLESAVWQVSSTGYTVFDALRNFASQSSRQLFWAHNRWLVIGEEVARAGVEDVLDTFFRDPEMRASVRFAVCKGGKGLEFLQTEVPLERVPSTGHVGIVLNGVEKLSTVVDVDLRSFFGALAADGLEPVAIRAEIIDQPPDDDPRGRLERTTIPATPRITGAAVFRGTKLVGWLNKAETRGLNWVKGKAQSGVILVEQPNERDKLISIEVVRSNSKMRTEVVDGKPVVSIEVEVMGNFADRQDFLVNPEGIAASVLSIERQMATVIRNEVEAAINRAKELGSDIFGFGQAFHRFHPQAWKQLRKEWNDKGFQELDVKIVTRAMLRRSGLIELDMPLAR
ncbi:MAG: Ger(x)C family spore germination protein [Limnochordia bacterium]